MKILHVINNLGSGGAEKLLEQTLPLMNKVKDLEVELLLLTDENNVFEKNLKDSLIKINVIKLRKIYDFRNVFYIRKFIISGKYDIVHVHLFPSQYWVSLASKLIFKNKPKLITTEHNTYNRRRTKRYFKLIDNIIYSSYDKIISISDKTQKNLISWLEPGINSMQKFIVIENGVDITKFSNANSYEKLEINENFDENTKLICMVGRFTEQKDQKTLIKAMKRLPEGTHLLLIGEGPLKKKNENLAKQLGVNNRVHFLGFRDDVERVLKTSDIIVLSSNWEGFGLVAVEGMAAGKPVIGTNVDGLSDVIGDQDMLFTRGNSEELAVVINKLISNTDFYYEKTINNIKLCEKYSISNMLNESIMIYKNVIR